MRWLSVIFCFVSMMYADCVRVLLNFNHKDIPIRWEHLGGNQFDLQISSHGQCNILPNDQKIIVMNNFLSTSQLREVPKDKLVLFVWEPVTVDAEYYQYFSRVYTWDDRLIDNITFFKFYYPYLMPFPDQLPSFEERKLCTLVTSHWTPMRTKIATHFSKIAPRDFEFYGTKVPGQLQHVPSYKGPIPGIHSQPPKIDTLKKYRFSICFENICDLPGYVTEKILNCFAAGCVPVYCGDSNISSVIPEQCYIPYHKFDSDNELYHYLSTMSELEYQQYVEAMRAFVNSSQSQIFSPVYFEELLVEAANS